MARRRKQTSDSRQLSLFDIMVSHIEQIREENIQDDIREEAGYSGSRRTNSPRPLRLRSAPPHTKNFRKNRNIPANGSRCFRPMTASPRKGSA